MRIIRPILLALSCAAALCAQCTISGTVTDPEGTPLHGGVIRFFNESTFSETAVGINDHTGRYTSPLLLCPASYTISVERPGSEPSTRTKQQLAAAPVSVTMDIVLFPASHQAGTAILLTGIFFSTLIFFRWHNIALLDQKQLEAEVAMTWTRLDLESDLPAKQRQVDALKSELSAAMEPFIRGGKGKKSRGRATNSTTPGTADEDAEAFIKGECVPVTSGSALRHMDILFWTRGQEIASWMRVREVQRLIVLVWPPHSTERLRASLQMAQQTLLADNSPSSAALGLLVRDALATSTPDDNEEERWRQLFLEVTGYIHASREESYSAITVWQSKAAWLAITACVLIVATVAARGGGMLFLAGAVGGFMSRLARALKASDTPTDYGASWNTLFLSPLLGSLAGFFGVLMIQGLGTGGAINVALTGAPLALPALAFLLGFSERLFDSLVSALDKQPQATQQAPQTAVPTPAAQALAATSVRDIQPFPALPGELLIVSGKGLEPARVDGVTLTAQDKSDIKLDKPPIQEAEQIRFNLPQNLAEGSYILTVKAKDAPFISKTVRVHQLPVLDSVNPTTAAASSSVTFKGQGLEPDVKVEVQDSADKPVAITGLTQAPAAITFTAPAAPGIYSLVLTLGTRSPLKRQFTVTVAAA